PVPLAAALHNDLEAAALSLRPELRATLDAGTAAGALAGMVSGSGPTCVFLAASAEHAAAVASGLAKVPACRLALTATGPAPGAHIAVERDTKG
ncbi:MAG: 4-(cytidine 5'-diphospho)-2-C-methyl-D-erythritol kinase, partial [Dactylosporangium sp.]|nr:4-(cytidine 5'-diphospho)-2-C-methyl-D-erythritol kinase [Dactylosporangium sp.]NNJ60280.1 4-(cytidine 5'-diphospho)-2-C-methyl-D-erythritol kinase [Dactylosporangium sp.]